MSKFFLTNNIAYYKQIKQRIESSEYKTAFSYSSSGFYALSTRKLSLNNDNGLKCEGGFIIITGTMAWEDGCPISIDTLSRVYCQFGGDINVIRNSGIGDYAVSVFKENILYVFSEISGFYNIYYYNYQGDWLISNSLYDLSVLLSGKLTLNKLALTEAIIQDGILLSDTYFKEINRLSGFNYIKIEDGRLRVIEEKHLYPLVEKGSIEEKAKKYSSLSTVYGKKMSTAYGTPCISMTGGLDARMVLSTYLSAGVKPHLYYGTGNSFITNTFNKDKEIDLLLSESFGLVFHDEKWSTTIPVDEFWPKFIELYGFYFETYGGSKTILDSIKNNQCQLLTFGYCGELLRNLPWIESRKSGFFTIEEYLNDFYITPSTIKDIINPDVFYSYIKEKHLKICRIYDLDPDHISNEDVFYLSLERRKSADSKMLNLVNLMKYCSYSLGEYNHLLAARVSARESSNSGFMLRCLNCLDSRMLDIPVFSHCHERQFDRASMSLIPLKEISPRIQQIKDIIKKCAPFIVPCYHKILRKNDFVSKDNIDEKVYQRLITLLQQFDNYDIVNLGNTEDKRKLLYYVTKLYVLGSLDFH